MTLQGIRCFLKAAARGEWPQLWYECWWRIMRLDLRAVHQDTLGISPDKANFYSDSGGPELKTVLKRLNILAAGNAIDIGCGKGGAMITLARHGFNRVDGLELSDKLVAIARKNLKTLCLDGMCSVYCGDAAIFDRYDDYVSFSIYITLSPMLW